MAKSIFRKDGTAQGVAKQRLIESLAKPDKRVIYDPYAKNFVAGSGLIELMGHRFSVWITQKFAPGFHEHLISRTKFIDDLIEKCAKEGAEQYVILGAGYDLRAHRLDLPSNMKIFELDQLEVQQRKRSKLPNDLPNYENVSYVSVDFSNESLHEQLLKAGFNSERSTVFTLEGVSQYISKEAVSATLKEISSLTPSSKSTFFISYVDQKLIDDPESCFGNEYPKAKKKAQMVMDLAAKVGEPWISFYSADEMKDLLLEQGFEMTQNKSLEDLNSTYFEPKGRKLKENEIFKLEYFVEATKNF